ncbi:unnamed protein product [Closterium sp. Yama58-4]|nr:unnamed protein product [Closterium sp. Yama58-4]
MPVTVFLRIPHPDLRILSQLLAQEGLSDASYSRAVAVLRLVTAVVPKYRALFVADLAEAARQLSSPATRELLEVVEGADGGEGGGEEGAGTAAAASAATGSERATMEGQETAAAAAAAGEADAAAGAASQAPPAAPSALAPVTGKPWGLTRAGAATLRVLKTLTSLLSQPASSLPPAWDGDSPSGPASEAECQAVISDLVASLHPLWQVLSECCGKLEARYKKHPALSASAGPAGSAAEGAAGVGGGAAGGSAVPPLPSAAQQLLPFVESFFVLCDKTSGKGKGAAAGGAAERHRRLLNAFVRGNPALLERSFAMLLKWAWVLDFDNKRAYFRARMRQLHEQPHYGTLRITVRRPYILEDSYNQLRMRTAEELRGRLNVHFQGQEGISARAEQPSGHTIYLPKPTLPS